MIAVDQYAAFVGNGNDGNILFLDGADDRFQMPGIFLIVHFQIEAGENAESVLVLEFIILFRCQMILLELDQGSGARSEDLRHPY